MHGKNNNNNTTAIATTTTSNTTTAAKQQQQQHSSFRTTAYISALTDDDRLPAVSAKPRRRVPRETPLPPYPLPVGVPDNTNIQSQLGGLKPAGGIRSGQDQVPTRNGEVPA